MHCLHACRLFHSRRSSPLTVVALFIASLIALSLSACESDGPTEPSGSSGPSGPTTATVSGVVTETSTGQPLTGVAVAAQNQTSTTGADGRFSLTGLGTGSIDVTARRQGHRNVSQTIMASAGTNTLNISMTPATAATYQGNWTGGWVNTTFGTSGTTTMSVTVDTIAQTYQATVDLNGNVFGIGDPAPQTLNGAYTDNGTTFSQSSLALGTLTFTIDANGNITGSATNLVVVPQINRLDFAGTISATQLLVNYIITFTGGATAVGTLTLKKT